MGGTRVSYGGRERESSWALAAGYRVRPDLAAGVTVKYVWLENLYGVGGKQSVVGFDLGGLFRKTLAPVTIRAGFNVKDIGPEMEFPSGASAPLGRNLVIGGGGVGACASRVRQPRSRGHVGRGSQPVASHRRVPHLGLWRGDPRWNRIVGEGGAAARLLR